MSRVQFYEQSPSSVVIHTFTVGCVDADIARAARAGLLLKVWPGVYVCTTTPHSRDELHRLRVVAVVRSCSESFVIGYQSAALIHAMPLLTPDHAKVHLVNCRTGGRRQESKRHIHGVLLPDGERCVIGGLAVTTIARTAVDVARSGTFDQAVTAFDSELRIGVDRAQMGAVLDGGMRGKHGLDHARKALLVANRLSETVGES